VSARFVSNLPDLLIVLIVDPYLSVYLSVLEKWRNAVFALFIGRFLSIGLMFCIAAVASDLAIRALKFSLY